MNKYFVMRAIVGAGLLLATSYRPVAADAKATPSAKGEKAPPTKEALQQYTKALAQGREADSKGQLAEARKHFEAAVALLPGGGAALSELGWVAYRLKDLKSAEQATRAAVRFSVQPSVRAGSLYNLGRILTDQGKKAEAVQAYKEGWELGRNPVTLAALKALDPAAAAAAWPGVQPLTGPVALVGATPEAQKQAACRAQLERVAKHQTDPESPLTLETLHNESAGEIKCELVDVSLPRGGALKKVLVVSAGYYANHYGLSTVGLWVQTHEGWFQDLVQEAESWKWEGASVSFTSAQAAGDLVEVRLSSRHWSAAASAHASKGGRDSGDSPPESPHDSEAFLYVLGVGPSGRPSLTAGINFSASRTIENDEGKELRGAQKVVPVKLQPSGELQIGSPVTTRKKMTEKEFPATELQTPTGTFKVTFP